MPAETPPETFHALFGLELQKLHEAGQQLRFAAGSIIFHEGDAGDGLYYVNTGRIEISAGGNGQERRVLAHLPSSTFFGEMAILDGQPRSATATAEVDSELTFVPNEVITQILHEAPPWLLSLVKEMALRMRRLDRRYLDEVLQAERLSVIGRFAQSIVHDLKNPLNIIGVAGELVGAEDTLPSERAEVALLIRKQVERLTNMTNEVLEFTSGSTAAGTLVTTDYGEFLTEVMSELRLDLVSKGVILEGEAIPKGIYVNLDRQRLLHVFFNLANNAVEFMPKGGKITLRFEITELEVKTSVQDTGPGIAPAIVERLFEPFATHGKAKGTGLGLAICKRIINDHDGGISAHSEPGQGAVFTFKLPRVRAR